MFPQTVCTASGQFNNKCSNAYDGIIDSVAGHEWTTDEKQIGAWIMVWN